MAGVIDKDGRSVVIFRLGSEHYGLGIEHVEGIIRFEQPTPVPRAPESVLGVINLRGRVIPVVDLCRRLGRAPLEPTAVSRIIVVEGSGGAVGLAVDEASEVTSIPLGDVRSAPDTAMSVETAEMLEGVADRDGELVILLDLEKAVPKAEYVRSAEESESEGDGDV